jgi:hypothetical protein
MGESNNDRIEFWQEFLRVMSDKLLLLFLIVLMILRHVDDRLTYLTIGGLVGVITGQRFRFKGVSMDPEKK